VPTCQHIHQARVGCTGWHVRVRKAVHCVSLDAVLHESCSHLICSGRESA
jgi:hypothetical protein